MTRHPHLPRDSWHRIVPIGFHGDGGGVNKHDSLHTFNWNSLLATGRTVQTRFLFTVVEKSDMVADTLDTLMKAFAWSCNILLSGETPLCDWKGPRISGGGAPLCDYRGCLVQVRGDWEFYVTLFRFPRWNEADVMCPFCRASSTDAGRLWTDFRREAGWRGTLFTHEGYLEHLRAAGLAVPALFREGVGAIGLRLDNVMVDILQTVDQGVASHKLGNILWYFAVIRCVSEAQRMLSASRGAAQICKLGTRTIGQLRRVYKEH